MVDNRRVGLDEQCKPSNYPVVFFFDNGGVDGLLVLLLVKAEIFKAERNTLPCRQVKTILVVDALIQFGARIATTVAKYVTIHEHSASTLRHS